MKNRLNIAGVTLIEVLMVLSIAMMIFYLAFQQYLTYSHDAEVKELKHDIDTVFLAMANNYWANCNPPYGFINNPCANGNGRSSFVVCPPTVTTVINPIPIDINSLITSNYLRVSDLSLNRIMDQSSTNNDYAASNGYSLNYNLYYQPNGNIPTRQLKVNGKIYDVAMIISWQMQLAIKLSLKASDAADTYGLLLGASCVSDYADKCGTKPPPKPGSPTPPPSNKYLIFTRFPNQANAFAQGPDDQIKDMVQGFKQMYDQQPDWYLASNRGSWPTYYYCPH